MTKKAKLVAIPAAVRDLFQAEEFTRKNFEADMYCGFSRKLDDEVFVYARERYYLWHKFEADPDIVKFNCRIGKVSVPTFDGGAGNFSPDGISLNSAHELCVHVIEGLEDPDFKYDSETEPASGQAKPDSKPSRKTVNWDKYCIDLSVGLKRWTPAELLGVAATRIAQTRLVRFSGSSSYIDDVALREAIVTELVPVHYLSIGEVLVRFCKRDPSDVKAEVAAMILDGKIFSDIHLAPLDLNTRISVRKIFPSQSNNGAAE
jgi:hypothetical protein